MGQFIFSVQQVVEMEFKQEICVAHIKLEAEKYLMLDQEDARSQNCRKIVKQTRHVWSANVN